jgi:hypothetical protein
MVATSALKLGYRLEGPASPPSILTVVVGPVRGACAAERCCCLIYKCIGAGAPKWPREPE